MLHKVAWAAVSYPGESVQPCLENQTVMGYCCSIKDGMINPDLQRFKAKLIKATTIELNSSHVPMVSQPTKVADFIIEAAQKL